MLTVEVRITGAKEMIAKLKQINTSLLNFREPLAQIGKELESYYSNNVFSDQGASLGVRWPTLAAKTIMYKKKHYPQYATTPLIATGTMKDSFVSKATINTVTVTNTAPQFKYHQSSAARKKIPYRPMMGINDDVKTIVKTILQADITQKLQGF